MTAADADSPGGVSGEDQDPAGGERRTDRAGRPAAVCLLVPSGTWDLAPLVDAIRSHGGGDSVVAVWCGDPHLRPKLPPALRTEWCDLGLEHNEPSGVGWNRLLVALHPRVYEWVRGAASIARMLDEGIASVALMRVGSIAVLGDISALIGDLQITLVGRVDGPIPSDGFAPGEADLIATGRHSIAVAGFRNGSQPALRWLIQQLLDAASVIGPAGSVTGTTEPGPWLDRMAEVFGFGVCPSVSIVAAGWPRFCDRNEEMSPYAVLDLDHLDRAEPWHFTFGSRPARVRLSEAVALAAAITECRPQREGVPTPVVLPGGIPVDGPVRSLMWSALRAARSGDGALPPEPYGPDHSAFTRWLEQSEPAGVDVGRYWMAVHELRPDLQAAFPQPWAADVAGLLEWAGVSWRLEDRTALLRVHDSATFSTPPPMTANVSEHAIRSIGFDPTGINVLGYLDFDQGQGEVARRIVAAFQAAAVPVAPLGFHRSAAPRRAGRAVQEERDARFATNLVVVTAAHFPFVVADHGRTLLQDRYTIAYWFWELEHIPPSMVSATRLVDEIWTGSQFVADAFAAVTDKPVRCVPIPVPEPQPSDRDRVSFGIPDDRFVFLTTFDQSSVPERKNPFGVIAAFTTAFADGEGPLLWIKTMNGARGWRNHERLLLAAAHRSDIVVWDEHLSRPDQMAVLSASDCLVSLHRSEGLGLHCAEAMWLAKPVIATRYSGNLDFMDDSCAALIDFAMVPVEHGEGIYPGDALWADPDIDEAAAWMRRLGGDSQLARVLGGAGRAKMKGQTSAASTGHMMARLARLQSTRG